MSRRPFRHTTPSHFPPKTFGELIDGFSRTGPLGKRDREGP